MRSGKKLNLVPLLLLVLLGIAFFVGMRGRGVGPSTVIPSPAPSVRVFDAEAAAGELSLGSTRTVRSEGTDAAESSAAAKRAVPSADKKLGDRDAVAAYIRAHGKLPDYYISKQEARKLGWEAGSLEKFAPGKLIGGDRFGNVEGLLPRKAGRTWTECDIGTYGKSSRGAERIVFSSDGLIYYTQDHYVSFVQLKEVD